MECFPLLNLNKDYFQHKFMNENNGLSFFACLLSKKHTKTETQSSWDAPLGDTWQEMGGAIILYGPNGPSVWSLFGQSPQGNWPHFLGSFLYPSSSITV